MRRLPILALTGFVTLATPASGAQVGSRVVSHRIALAR